MAEDLRSKINPSALEEHCARAVCIRDRADPERKVRGQPLWLHYVGTVRNVLAVVEAAKGFIHA